MIECVLIQWNELKTDYVIINMNAQILDEVVVGLNPDLEYLVKRTPYSAPDHDPRLFNLITTQSYVDELDTEYTTLKKWVTTYSLEARTIEEKKVSVDEMEAICNLAVFPSQKHLKLLTLALAMLEKKVEDGTITTLQQSVIDMVVNKALNIWSNKQNAEAIRADIEAETPVDLDSGWNITDPED